MISPPPVIRPDQFGELARRLPAPNMPAMEEALRQALNEAEIALADMLAAHPDDEDIARAFKYGFLGTEVRDEFVYRFEKRIWAACIRFGAEYNLAFDLTQQTFLRLFENRLRSYLPKPNGIWPYLQSTARNCFRDHLRRVRPHAVLPEDLIAQDDTEEEVYRAELASRFANALSSLSPEERAVVELTIETNMNHDEISRHLGITIQQSYKRLFEGRAKLRRLLGRSE